MSHVFHRDPRHCYPVAVKGEGAYLYDREGRRYLDASGGAAVSCLGHSDRAVTEAIARQLERLPFAVYALRTVVLPFVFVFNPMLLLIDVRGWFEVVLVALAATTASLLFAAATLGWFHARCKWWEIALFRPDAFMDRIAAPYTEVAAKEIFRVAGELPEDDRLVLVIEGTTIEGEDVRKTVAVQLGPPGEGRKRLAEAGLTISALGPEVRVSAVKFGSRARKSGFEQGFKVAAVKVPTDRPSEHWVYIPALALAAFVWFLQRARTTRKKRAASAALSR